MKSALIIIFLVGLMATGAQAAAVNYLFNQTSPNTWDVLASVSGTDTAGLSAYGIWVYNVDPALVSYEENVLFTLDAEYHTVGFSPGNLVQGNIGESFNAGNFQSYGDYAITGIGMVPVDVPSSMPDLFSDVQLDVPALLGTLTTPEGMSRDDFAADGAAVLNATGDGFLQNVEVTDCDPDCFSNIPGYAHPGGPYEIEPGNILTLDASGSSGPIVDNEPFEIMLYEWDLDGDGIFETSANTNSVFQVSPAYLESLQLDIGYYYIQLKITGDWEGDGYYAGTALMIGTPPIFPEPATMSLLVLGGIAMIRRKRNLYA